MTTTPAPATPQAQHEPLPPTEHAEYRIEPEVAELPPDDSLPPWLWGRVGVPHSISAWLKTLTPAQTGGPLKDPELAERVAAQIDRELVESYKAKHGSVHIIYFLPPEVPHEPDFRGSYELPPEEEDALNELGVHPSQHPGLGTAHLRALALPVVVRRPTKRAALQYLEKILSEQRGLFSTDPMDQGDEEAVGCVCYPSRAEFETYQAERPTLINDVRDSVAQLAYLAQDNLILPPPGTQREMIRKVFGEKEIRDLGGINTLRAVDARGVGTIVIRRPSPLGLNMHKRALIRQGEVKAMEELARGLILHPKDLGTHEHERPLLSYQVGVRASQLMQAAASTVKKE